MIYLNQILILFSIYVHQLVNVNLLIIIFDNIINYRHQLDKAFSPNNISQISPTHIYALFMVP